MGKLSQLKIKTNVVRRLFKEEQYYIKEVEQLTEKLKEYNNSPEFDEYEARQKQRIIDEAKDMLPDCKKRLLEAANDLSELLKTEFDPSKGPIDENELKEATEALQSIIIA